MQATQKIFLWGLGFFVALGAALGAFLFVSLWPYFSIIGKVAAGVVMVGLACGAALIIAWTYSRVGIWNARRRTIVHGEVVAYLNHDGTFVHLSAEHVRAGVPRMLPAPVDETPFKPDEQDIINIYNANKDVTLKQLGAQFQMPYNQVQKIYAEADKRGLITRKSRK